VIARACLATMLPPAAFGVSEPEDVAAVGAAIMAALVDAEREQSRERALADLRGMLGRG